MSEMIVYFHAWIFGYAEWNRGIARKNQWDGTLETFYEISVEQKALQAIVSHHYRELEVLGGIKPGSQLDDRVRSAYNAGYISAMNLQYNKKTINKREWLEQHIEKRHEELRKLQIEISEFEQCLHILDYPEQATDAHTDFLEWFNHGLNDDTDE